MNKKIKAVMAAVPVAGLVMSAAACSTHTVTRAVPGPTITKTVTVPGPTVTTTVPVPGPTVTTTVPAPPPPAGTAIGTFNGTGNQVTPAFNVPGSGNYIVAWSYTGNVDNSLGSSQPTNFSISETGSGIGGNLPNDIATSGHGSTEVTGAGSTDSLNVQAAGSWTITITSAS
jgi:hypothetical protein